MNCTNISFLGDVHGQYADATRIIEKCDHPVIQVGDWGFGMAEQPDQWPVNLSVLRGNHDNPEVARSYSDKFLMPVNDYGPIAALPIFTLGGGFSIDRHLRTLGVDYWEDEELGFNHLGLAIEQWIESDATILVTHEPSAHIVRAFGLYPPSRTALAIENMIRERKPRLHIFGHFHKSIEQNHDGVAYFGLDILELRTINVFDWM